MTAQTRLRSIITAVLLAAAAGCADVSRQPLEPPLSQPENFTLGSLVGGLLSCTPLPYDSVSQAVGPQGGLIRVGGHSLLIPAGSLDSTVLITAVAPSGSVRMVRFQPQGLQFANGAVVTLNYANCSLVSRLIPKRVAYIDGSQNILEVLLSFDNIWSQSVSGRLKHFSDYAVAW
jgi:hypothetical protein